VDELGHVLFTSLRRGGFCTFVVSGRRSWNPHSHYFNMARQAAGRGLKITRAFLLPHRHYRSDTTLIEHIQMDRAAGLAVEVLVIGDLLSSSAIPLVESLDFGLWDETVLCTAIRSPHSDYQTLSEWRVSSRPEDVQHGQELITLLLNKATRLPTDGREDQLNLEEPMLSTAPIADFLSSVLCRGNHVSSEDCSWYHSIWQYLRVFNLVSTPTWHSEFYFSALKTVLSSLDQRRVLISGAADYSTLAHVLWTLGSTSPLAKVTVLDLCETPLFLCRWYAKSVGSQIDAVSADILTYTSESPFDCIVTDAFLTRFPPAERTRIIQRWWTLLSADGRVITTVRLEKASDSTSLRATPAQADSFRHRAIKEATKWADFLNLSPAEIGRRARRYAEQMTSYPVESSESLRRTFEDNGFVMDSLHVVEVPGELAPTIYAEVVARKASASGNQT